MSCCERPTPALSTPSSKGCCDSSCCTPAQPRDSSCCSSSCCTPSSTTPSQTPPGTTPSPTSCCSDDTSQRNCGSSQSSCCEPSTASSSCCEMPSTKKVSGLSKPSCCDLKLPQGSEVKQQVISDYSRVALSSSINADAVAAKFGYSQQDLSAIPQGANMGVSCGNPLALTNLKEGEVVVDLGCGRGLDVFLASPKVGPSGKVYGIDMTPEMLAKARENATKKNITNVEFLQGDIEALPLADNSVDLVISNCVINLVPDKQKAFIEIFRVLKPGGRLAISDILKKKALPEELRDKIELISSCFVGAMTHSDAVGFLQKAGFKSILISDANVDLNAYKMLGEAGEGCCGGSSGCGTGISKTSKLDIDFNEFTFSGKIFASKE